MKKILYMFICISFIFNLSLTVFSVQPPAETPKLEKVITGDFNNNGRIDSFDAKHIYNIIFNNEQCTDEIKNILDINSDGELSIKDVQLALKISAKLK